MFPLALTPSGGSWVIQAFQSRLLLLIGNWIEGSGCSRKDSGRQGQDIWILAPLLVLFYNVILETPFLLRGLSYHASK